jgi:hypothetical protein
MGNLKIGFIDSKIIVKQDIDVDRTVMESGEWRVESGELAAPGGVFATLP